MAGYEATTARKFYSAMRNGSRSVDAHEKVLKMRPDYYDALLSVGMYDYIAGSLPFGIKALALFAGVRGNKERGISRLKTIIENNAVTADDARVMLIAIYRNEKRNEDALQVINHLTAKYPKSYLLKLETAALLVSLKRPDEAYAAFEALLKDPTAASVYDLVNYQYAEALARAGEYQRAAQQFTSVPKVQGGDANLATVSLLRAGQVYDLAGNREEAIAQYKAVLARPNIYDTQMQAEKGLNKPFAEREKKGE
jgi:tetratricopeptide (TPR) repeat protein